MRAVRLPSVLLVVIVSAVAQSTLPRDVLVLARAKEKVAARLSALTNYACLETTERWNRKRSADQFKFNDTLREVAHVGGRELYSWPGARSFSENTPAELIGFGAAATGGFALHLRAIFLSGGTITTFEGEENLDGRPVLRYRYQVPSFLGGTVITIGGKSGTATMRGSFWADR